MRRQLFFFEQVKWGIKKSVFSYCFQKCTYDLSKKCTQKKFCPKNRYSIGKIVFWLKLFLGALFTKVICTFWKSVQKDWYFDAPFDLTLTLFWIKSFLTFFICVYWTLYIQGTGTRLKIISNETFVPLPTAKPRPWPTATPARSPSWFSYTRQVETHGGLSGLAAPCRRRLCSKTKQKKH